MIEDRILDACRQRFAQEPDVMGVWLLGSAVSGRLREDSDVDFALLYAAESSFDFERHGQLAWDLEGLLGRRIDLGRLDTRNLIYANQAMREGQLIYERVPELAGQFGERVMALYFDLKRDRKVVEDAYCA